MEMLQCVRRRLQGDGQPGFEKLKLRQSLRDALHFHNPLIAMKRKRAFFAP